MFSWVSASEFRLIHLEFKRWSCSNNFYTLTRKIVEKYKLNFVGFRISSFWWFIAKNVISHFFLFNLFNLNHLIDKSWNKLWSFVWKSGKFSCYFFVCWDLSSSKCLNVKHMCSCLSQRVSDRNLLSVFVHSYKFRYYVWCDNLIAINVFD